MREGIVGVVLAGGLSRRMGVDKASVLLAGRPLLDHVVARLGPQVGRVLVNANGPMPVTDLPVVPDRVATRPGPLAGIDAALDWCLRHAPEARWLATAPCDMPSLPGDMVARLLAGVGGAPAACASAAGQVQPLVALWGMACRNEVARALEHGEGSPLRVLRALGAREVVFETDAAAAFANLNRPEDLARTEATWARKNGRAHADTSESTDPMGRQLRHK